MLIAALNGCQGESRVEGTIGPSKRLTRRLPGKTAAIVSVLFLAVEVRWSQVIFALGAPST